jgi:NAD(P)-dependent dehydrogenase (short-subunit alcohol dehydrogenase family)
MLPLAFDIANKVVCITGAGRGIGKGIAQVLAAAGADVVLNALTPRYVEQTTAEIAKETGRRVMPLLADVTKADEVQQSAPRRWSPCGDLENSKKWGFWPCISPHRPRIT